MNISLWFKKMLSEGDNETLCPIRVGGGIMIAVYHAAAVGGLITHALALDWAALGQYVNHMTQMIGAAAASVGAKSLMKADAPPEAK